MSVAAEVLAPEGGLQWWVAAGSCCTWFPASELVRRNGVAISQAWVLAAGVPLLFDSYNATTPRRKCLVLSQCFSG